MKAKKCLLCLFRGSLELFCTHWFLIFAAGELEIRMWREQTLCEGLEMFVMSLSRNS